MDIVEQLRDYINYVDDIALRKIAADEIAKLRAELAEANQTIEEQIKVRHAWEMHSALQDKELAEAKKDAERYRWLKAQHWSHKTLTVTKPEYLTIGTQTYCGFLLDDEIDEAIYTYMTREQQP
jgi:hypothetical protein